MATLNKVMLIGNLTRDPELRYTPQGKAVVTLGLAVNRNFKSQGGEKKQDTCFINVVAWGQLAEICNQYLQKGRPVFVEGRLQSRTWQDQEGKNRSVIETVAENVQFLGARGQVSAQGSDQGSNMAAQPEQKVGAGFMGNAPQAAESFEEEIIIPGEEEMF